MTCSYSYHLHRKAVKADGKRACMIHIEVVFHSMLAVITQAQIIKKNRNR